MSQGNFFRIGAVRSSNGGLLQVGVMAAGYWYPSMQEGSTGAAVFPASGFNGSGVERFQPGDQLLVDCDERLEFHVGDGEDWDNAKVGYKASGFGPILIEEEGALLYLRPLGGGAWGSGPVVVGASV